MCRRLHRGGDAQQVIEAGGGEVIGLDPPHGKDQPRFALQRRLIDPQRPHQFAARPFDKLKVAGIIDDARKVRILVTGADGVGVGNRVSSVLVRRLWDVSGPARAGGGRAMRDVPASR